MTETPDLLIPFSLAKRYLSSSGCRSSPDGAKELQNIIKEFALQISEVSSKIVKDRNQQTITDNDVKNALIQFNDNKHNVVIENDSNEN